MTRATTYDARLTHARKAPVHNRFRYRTRSWLVDLDHLPQLPRGLRWLASFESRDHLGDPHVSLRDNVRAFLAGHGIDITGGRILMLANARALGCAVNPISIHWCYTSEGSLTAVVAEVHNTYGDRHAYLLPVGGGGRVDHVVEKQMYVSPFNPIDGTYHIIVSPPGERVSVSVTLARAGHPQFVASWQGHRNATRPLVLTAARAAATSARTSALIHWQGIRLLLRGLRVEPRPIHPPQKAV